MNSIIATSCYRFFSTLSRRCVSSTTPGISPEHISTTSIKRPQPSIGHELALSSSFSGLVNTPGTAIRSFTPIFLLFAVLFHHVHGAAVGVDHRGRPAGDIRGPLGPPGPPGLLGLPGPPGPPVHKTPPGREGSGMSPITTSDLTTSTSVDVSPTSTPPPSSWEIFASSITISSTLSWTSSAVFSLSSPVEPKAFTSTRTSASSSSFVSAWSSILAATRSSTTSSTALPSEWSKITPTIITSTPTTADLNSTKQSPGKRNQTIILTTVLVTLTLSILACLLFLTRCFTRRPSFSTLCLRRSSLIPVEEIESWRIGTTRMTERGLPRAITPSAPTDKLPTMETSYPHAPTPVSTQTPTPTSRASTTSAILTSPKTIFGLTLPSFKGTSSYLSPFSPRGHPTKVAGSPRHSQYLSQHSQHSLVSSTQSTRSKTVRNSGQSSGSGPLSQKPPARYTFGDHGVGQWALGREQGRDSETSELPQRIRAYSL